MSSKHNINFYDILGVSPDADVATIEKAFRAISITTHPDKANAATRPKSGVESPDEQRAREQKNHDRYVQIVEARNTLTDDKKRKAYNSKHGIRADNDRNTSQRESGSESKSKSASKSAAGDSSNDLIAIHQSSLEFQLSSIDYLNKRIRDLLYTLESLSRQSSRYSETTSLLEDILRKSKTAKDEIKNVMQDLEALRRRSLRDSEKRTKARELYHSVISGPLEYLQRAETMVDELTATIEQSRR